MPNPPVTISDAESRVMEVLWQKAPQTSEDIVAALLAPTGWHEKTIKTLLNRLLGKGAVSAEKDGRRYLYSPQLRREDWQRLESRSLLDRVFGGKSHRCWRISTSTRSFRPGTSPNCAS
jgi:Predicted transcriptional regulator